MASSEVEICNQALLQVGARRITALTDVSREARLCNEFYPKTLQEVLRMAPWQSCKKEVELALDTIPQTVFTYKNSFQLPSDYIRVWATSLDIEWGGSGQTWEIQGRKLITDESTIKISYTYRVTDVTLFDTLLEKALTLDLAMKLAYPLAQMVDIQKTFEGMRDRAVRQAMALNTQEHTKKRFRSTSLTGDVR